MTCKLICLQLMLLATYQCTNAKKFSKGFIGRPTLNDNLESHILQRRRNRGTENKDESNIIDKKNTRRLHPHHKHSPKKHKCGPKSKKAGRCYDDDYYYDEYYDDYADDVIYPSVDDITFLDDAFFDDGFFDGACRLVTFNETFVLPPASLYLAPDTTLAEPGTPELPGTVFIFERSDILEPDGVTPLEGATVSGVCTRTTVGSDGGGTCKLVFIDTEGFTINVEGYLQGPLGNPMAIIGGTGGMVGVIGEMDFFPIYSNATQGDIFMDPLRYEVIADLGLVVCP